MNEWASERISLTVPPAVELVLQPGDSVPQGLVLLLLSFILLLPLLCSQLHIDTHRVLDGLRSAKDTRNCWLRAGWFWFFILTLCCLRLKATRSQILVVEIKK